MKHFLSILLLLSIFLCGCTVSTDRNPYSNQPLPTGAVDHGDGVLSGEVHSDVQMQMIRDYQTTELFVESGLSKVVEDVFSADEGYWVCFSVYEDSEYKARMERYTEAGELIETVYVPQPKGLSDDGLQMNRAYTACPLRAGQWFLLTSVYDGIETFPQAFILSAEGDILHSMTVPFPMTLGTYCARSDGDGGLYFLIHDDKTLWYYDETLTECAVITPSDGAEYSTSIAQLAGDVFCISRDMAYGGGEYIIDLSKQNIRVVNRMLPDEFRFSRFLYGLNGELYVLEGEGISRYTDNGTLVPILKWSECGIQKDFSDSYWIINDTNIVRRAPVTVAGQYSRTLSHIEVSEREIPTDLREIRIKICSDFSSNWLMAAISEFNRSSDQYYVTADVIPLNEFNDVLLYDDETDLLFQNNIFNFEKHYDKKAFYDIGYEVQDILLEGIYDSYLAEDGALYSFPLSWGMTALAAKSDLIGDSALNWEQLYTLRDTLADGAYLLAPGYIGGVGSYIVDQNGQRRPLGIDMTDIIPYMYYYALADYVDYKGMTSSFDSPQFREMILFLDWLSSHVDANIGGTQFANIGSNSISNGMLIDRMREDGVAFVETEISSVLHFSLLQRLYGEHDYSLYGLPSADGGYVINRYATLYPAILADTDVLPGCIAFIKFLLSDEMQSHSLLECLPVTASAMRAQLDAHQYQYYHTEDIEMIENASAAEIQMAQIDSWHEEIEDYGSNSFYTFKTYHFSEEDKAKILDFFSGIQLRSSYDTNILHIVNEELSYWKHNARSLEESTKIIDSRVWIYLNE